ncbi:hypothetical protein [Mycobacterium sp. 1423905.2]|uniref:hypothetical protein n=1 Tax=Mycobacterium sp. 1423905.2 TaxID=1856859 RepID=UPI0007FE9FFC|nr:hypothetical protein [Mycobacterium sp. 1423905.2]OBJ48226.1 hypothetical protein A9W95_04905 [Mycobacterium sp. 1423905.2]
MIGRSRSVVELVVAAGVLVAAAVSWAHTRTTVAVAPVAEGQPATHSVVFHPDLLVLTLFLATVAGVLAVVAVARLRRAKPSS